MKYRLEETAAGDRREKGDEEEGPLRDDTYQYFSRQHHQAGGAESHNLWLSVFLFFQSLTNVRELNFLKQK